MISVENNTNATENKKSVVVHNFEIADKLLFLGFKLKRIVKDRNEPEKYKPVYLFENEGEINTILRGLIEKARTEREERMNNGQDRIAKE